MTASLLAVLLGCAVEAAVPPARSARPAPSAAQAPFPAGVWTTTETVSSLYTGDRVRDPFTFARASRASRRGKRAPLKVSIHSLRLNGILEDGAGDYAVLSTDAGDPLLLRGGRLYDQDRRRIPKIIGRIDLRQRRVTLIGEDGDVQRYTLGETHDDD